MNHPNKNQPDGQNIHLADYISYEINDDLLFFVLLNFF